jgi:hypothetical protein
LPFAGSHNNDLSLTLRLTFGFTTSTKTMPSSPPPNDEETKGKIKDYGRDSRLSFRNFAEHQLRKEFKEDAIEKCGLQIKAFAECGKEEGIMVVFRCRDFQASVNECMGIYNSKEAWEKYKKDHEFDLDKRIIRSKN